MEIIQYEDQYQQAFMKLNLQWLDQYQLTESHDLMVLDDPRGTIIDRGGFIWLARENQQIIGSIALMKTGSDGIFELAKMSVAPEMRGKGISKQLLSTCLDKAKQLGARSIILFSNHQLLTAIRLYEQFGFRHVTVTDSPFVTADVKMQLLLQVI